MELEEMQAAWSQMSQELEKQKQLTDEIILKMTQQKYTSQWNKIFTAEKIGGVVCYVALVVLLANFKTFDTISLQVSAILCMLILAVLPILSLKTIRGMQQVNVTKMNYKETMETYAKGKKNFVNFQKLNVGISFLFMTLTVPVSAKLFNDENLFETLDPKLGIAVPFMLVFFGLLIWFVTRCYKKVLRSSETILKEIEE
ncbi:hypothetical protein [uncultured Dokdonia sp.]|uniref:hypothetical protein n=1 Tax=uncultured Dokdonia sp. TaxID=575653 RepID=UPI00262A2380|nr:hypothetical protein [uncultured Dokdonia sp.]